MSVFVKHSEKETLKNEEDRSAMKRNRLQLKLLHREDAMLKRRQDVKPSVKESEKNAKHKKSETLKKDAREELEKPRLQQLVTVPWVMQ